VATLSTGSSRWLFGPVPDLLLGCGALYAVLFTASMTAGAEIRGAQPYFLFPLLVLLLSTPHYGATLLRVYEERADRRGYILFSFWATLLVLGVFVAAIHIPALAIGMVTLYFTWSPWHYTGQNYGLSMMFLRRRGVRVSPAAKRLVYTSFVLSYALVFLSMHVGEDVSLDRPLSGYGAPIAFQSLGIPEALTDVLAPIVIAAYLAAIIGAALLLRRAGSLGDLAPSALLILTQALWFAIPFAVRHWRIQLGIEPLDWSFRSHYFSWIVAGHAIQYLWITTYYSRASKGWNGYATYLGKVLVAGLAVWTLPSVLFAPSLLGNLPFHFGLGLLVAAAVNIHHFILDGAIWKLRQSRVAGVLIRPTTDGDREAAGGASGRPGWGRRLVWTTAAAGCALGLYFFWEETVAYPLAAGRGDYAAALRAQDRLDPFGRSNFVVVRDLRRAERLRAEGRHPERTPGKDGPRPPASLRR
jgi:hypothetical protein